METKIEQWIDTLRQNVEKNSIAAYPTCAANHYSIRFTKGKKNYKLIRYCPTGQHRISGSAYCFIEIATGDIFMAAGWAQPAKGARGNVSTVNTESFDGSTRWLYRR